MSRRSPCKGFTLVELLVVIMIIALLAALLFPTLAKARERARQAKCISQQRQIMQTLTLWAESHSGTTPTANQLDGVATQCAELLKCPDLPKCWGYGFNEHATGQAISSFLRPSKTVILLDRHSDERGEKPHLLPISAPPEIANRHNGATIAAYLDGHVTLVSPADIFFRGHMLADINEAVNKFPGLFEWGQPTDPMQHHTMHVQSGRYASPALSSAFFPFIAREMSLYPTSMSPRPKKIILANRFGADYMMGLKGKCPKCDGVKFDETDLLFLDVDMAADIQQTSATDLKTLADMAPHKFHEGFFQAAYRGAYPPEYSRAFGLLMMNPKELDWRCRRDGKLKAIVEEIKTMLEKSNLDEIDTSYWDFLYKHRGLYRSNYDKLDIGSGNEPL